MHSETDFMTALSLNDHMTWKQYHLPSDAGTQWAISEDFSFSGETSELGDNGTFYMVGNYNGFPGLLRQ